MRLILSAIVLMGALAAGAASTCSTAPTAPKVTAVNLDGGFGRGYSVFHSYGWARGAAGYGAGTCYWRPALCAKDED
jgi:hypothetical protein